MAIAIRNGSGQWLRADIVELPIYSLTKTYIAAVIMALQIDIEQTIDRWLPTGLVPRAADISVRQLLCHTSGLRDYGALPEYSAAIEKGEAAWSDETFADYTLRRPLLFEPGKGWSYSNPGYWLLVQIAERAADAGFDELLERYIINPLELSNTHRVHGVFADDLPGFPAEWVWHGLLTATPGDVVTFMASGLVAPLGDVMVAVPGHHPGWRSPHYGLGLMIEPGVRYGHNGGGPRYSASCFHFLSSGTTGCVLLRTDDEEGAMRLLLDKMKAAEGAG